MAWTVNNNKEKNCFTEKGIPFLTDSAGEEREEAWIPPKRRMTSSHIAQTYCNWSMLPVLIVMLSIPLFCFGI